MISKDILEDYYYCKKAVEAGRYDEYDKAVVEESERFLNSLESSRDRQICKLRFVQKYSHQCIAMQLGRCDEGTIRKRIHKLIKEFNSKEKNF